MTQAFHSRSIGQDGKIFVAPGELAAYAKSALVVKQVNVGNPLQELEFTDLPILERPAANPSQPSVVSLGTDGSVGYTTLGSLAGVNPLAVKYYERTNNFYYYGGTRRTSWQINRYNNAGLNKQVANRALNPGVLNLDQAWPLRATLVYATITDENLEIIPSIPDFDWVPGGGSLDAGNTTTITGIVAGDGTNVYALDPLDLPISTLTGTALAKRVAVDQAQAFSPTEKNEGRTNLGLGEADSPTFNTVGIGAYGAYLEGVGSAIRASSPFESPLFQVIKPSQGFPVREKFFIGKVDDSGDDALILGNATGLDGSLSAGLFGYLSTIRNRPALVVQGMINAVDDVVDAYPVVVFRATRTSSSTDPTNGIWNGVTTRKLFAWGTSNPADPSGEAYKMTLGPQGDLAATGSVQGTLFRFGESGPYLDNIEGLISLKTVLGNPGTLALGELRTTTIQLAGPILVSNNQVFVRRGGETGGISFNTPAGIPAIQISNALTDATASTQISGDGRYYNNGSTQMRAGDGGFEFMDFTATNYVSLYGLDLTLQGDSGINLTSTTGSITLANGSSLRSGNPTVNYGGSGGITLQCAVGYDLRWEAGALYAMNPSGTTIRTTSYQSTTPDVGHNATLGYVAGSRYLTEDGRQYSCLTTTTGNASWELFYDARESYLHSQQTGNPHNITMSDIEGSAGSPYTLADQLTDLDSFTQSVADRIGVDTSNQFQDYFTYGTEEYIPPSVLTTRAYFDSGKLWTWGGYLWNALYWDGIELKTWNAVTGSRNVNPFFSTSTFGSDNKFEVVPKNYDGPGEPARFQFSSQGFSSAQFNFGMGSNGFNAYHGMAALEFMENNVWLSPDNVNYLAMTPSSVSLGTPNLWKNALGITTSDISDLSSTYASLGGANFTGSISASNVISNGYIVVGGISTGPRIDESSGTIRARVNNGSADAPFSCAALTASGTVAGGSSGGHNAVGFNMRTGTGYAQFQMNGGSVFGLASSSTITFGTNILGFGASTQVGVDVNINRATGGTLNVGSNGANALGSLACNAITASGNLTLSVGNFVIWGINSALHCPSEEVYDFRRGPTGSRRLRITSNTVVGPNDGCYAFSSTVDATGAADAIMSRLSPGVIQFGTTAKNALGSIACANVTATGASIFIAGAAASVPVTVKGAVSQSGNYQTWATSADAQVMALQADGILVFNSAGNRYGMKSHAGGDLAFGEGGLGNIRQYFTAAGIGVPSNGGYWWGNGGAQASATTTVSRQADGIVQIGTSGFNALGTLAAALYQGSTASSRTDVGNAYGVGLFGSIYNYSQGYTSGGPRFITDYQGKVGTTQPGYFGWAPAGDASAVSRTRLSEVSAGIVQIGGTSNDSTGSLYLTNLRVGDTGTVLANSVAGSVSIGNLTGTGLRVWNTAVTVSSGLIYLASTNGFIQRTDGSNTISFSASSGTVHMNLAAAGLDVMNSRVGVLDANNFSNYARLVYNSGNPLLQSSVGTFGFRVGDTSFKNLAGDTDASVSLGGLIASKLIRMATEPTYTPTGTTQTIDLNAGNHQTLDLSLSTGAMTVTFTVPLSSADGTVLIKQHGTTSRAITWAVSSGTIKWFGTQPTWASDAIGSVRGIAWRWNGSVLYIGNTEVAV